MRRRWRVTATTMLAVVGFIGLPVVPVPAELLGIVPIQPSLTGEIDPIPRQALSTAAPGTGGAATFGSPVIITGDDTDRKSTRLNSSHDQISYAVFCLKKKNNIM